MANKCFGGFGSLKISFTKPSPIPRLHPVINTEFILVFAKSSLLLLPTKEELKKTKNIFHQLFSLEWFSFSRLFCVKNSQKYQKMLTIFNKRKRAVLRLVLCAGTGSRLNSSYKRNRKFFTISSPANNLYDQVLTLRKNRNDW